MSRRVVFGSLLILGLAITTASAANTQIVLKRGNQTELAGEYAGVVDLAIDPGIDNAKVAVLVDGQKLSDGLCDRASVADPTQDHRAGDAAQRQTHSVA